MWSVNCLKFNLFSITTPKLYASHQPCFAGQAEFQDQSFVNLLCTNNYNFCCISFNQFKLSGSSDAGEKNTIVCHWHSYEIPLCGCIIWPNRNIYGGKRSGPSMEPCGTPSALFIIKDMDQSYLTVHIQHCFLFDFVMNADY